MPLSINL